MVGCRETSTTNNNPFFIMVGGPADNFDMVPLGKPVSMMPDTNDDFIPVAMPPPRDGAFSYSIILDGNVVRNHTLPGRTRVDVNRHKSLDIEYVSDSQVNIYLIYWFDLSDSDPSAGKVVCLEKQRLRPGKNTFTIELEKFRNLNY
jgi:hypothetical protein